MKHRRIALVGLGQSKEGAGPGIGGDGPWDAEIRSACAGLGLREECVVDVLHMAADLRAWIADGMSDLPTARERSASVERVANLAQQLEHAMRTMPAAQAMAVDAALSSGGFPRSDDALDPEHSVLLVSSGVEVVNLTPHLQLAAHVVGSLNSAATQARSRMPLDGMGGGRKPTRVALAGYIAALARLLKGYGIAPGRGGDFERFCAVVFVAARVPSKPDGAIRYFMKEFHADYQSKGWCL